MDVIGKMRQADIDYLCEQQAHCEDDICNDAGADDQCSLWNGPVLQEVGVLGIKLTLGIIIRECNIAAEWDSSQRILHILSLKYNMTTSDKKQHYFLRIQTLRNALP